MSSQALPPEVLDRIAMLRYEPDPAARLEAWREIVAAHPHDLPARLNLADALLEVGDVELARATCDKARAAFGETAAIAAQRALIEHAAGDEEAALSLAEQAIAGGYEFPPVLAMRADILASRGRTEEAKQGFLDAYMQDPHGWSALERYCALDGRAYRSPCDDVPSPITPLERLWLYAYIDDVAHTPDEAGAAPGCDHTLRLTRRWTERVGVDPVALYQFVNARGGFCDCEVIFNVEERDHAFDRLVVTAGVAGDASAFAGALVERGLAREGEPHPIELDPSEPDDENELDDEDEPPMLTLSAAAVPPQLVSARLWGRLAWAAYEALEGDALLWAIVAAPDDEDSTWLFTSQRGAHRCARIEDIAWEELASHVRVAARAGLDALRAAMPTPPAAVWIEPIALPAAVPGVPRVLYHGDDLALRVAVADGSTTLAAGLVNAFHASPSPDGSRLAYVELRPGSERLVIVDVASGERRRALRAEHFGESLAWLDAERLYVDVGAEGRLVSADGSVTTGLPPCARPSRDGSALVFPDGSGMTVQDLSGRVRHRLAHEGYPWAFSPDGRSVVFTAVERERHRVYLWYLDENRPRAMTSERQSSYWPSFLPDGESLVVHVSLGRRGEGPGGIILVPTRGGAPITISEGRSDERPIVHPRLPWIAWQRRDRAGTAIVTRSPSGVETVLPERGSEPIFWP